MLNLTWLAKRYEGLTSCPDNPEVREAYRVFAAECAAQFERIPVKVVFTGDDPYKTSKEMFSDIDNGVMRVFTGGASHPLLSATENSVFRAVHDYFGHYLNRAGFNVDGEMRAYRAHRRMFTPCARRALKTETIGQVAVYFFGSKPKQYAEQKAMIL